MIQLIGFCYEGEDHLIRGASQAPTLLRWGWQTGEDYSLLFNTISPPVNDYGDFYFHNLSPEEASHRAQEILKQKLAPHRPFLVLGGDHTVSFFALNHLLSHGVKPRVIHLDAHLDRRIEYKGIRLGHATVMHRLSELMGADRILSLGVRSRAQEEVVDERCYYPYEVVEPLKKILADSSGDIYYLSLDLDVLDPGFFSAVGYPEPGGISPRELYTVLQLLRGRVIAADMVEYIPLRDPGGVFAQVAGTFLREILVVLGSFHG